MDPRVAAYLKRTGQTIDEAIAYFERLENKGEKDYEREQENRNRK